MSRKPENQFISSVHAHLAPQTPYKMKNNNAYISGIADVWYSGKDADMWVEYKYMAKIPKSDSIDIGCTKLQKDWLRDRYYENRAVYVILGTAKGGILFDNLDWEKTFTQRELVDRIITRKELAIWIAEFTVGFYSVPTPTKKKLERIA